jgi:antitoxin (DNA-binding transcriptional repressor) of toxin-antitoxin stability system
MSRTLPLVAAQPKLSELVAGMVPGEELVLTANGEPVAIVIHPPAHELAMSAGNGQGSNVLDVPRL